MKLIFRIVLPFIGSVYLALAVGQLLHLGLSKGIFLAVLSMWLLNNFLNLFYEKHLRERRIHERHWQGAVVIAALLLTAGCNYFVPSGKPLKIFGRFTVTAMGVKNDSSSAAEVWITGINSGGGSVDLSTIGLDSNWSHKGAYLVASPLKPAPLEITINDPSRPSISFFRHDWSGKVIIRQGYRLDTIDLYKTPPRAELVFELKSLAITEIREFSPLTILYALLALIFWTTLVFVLFTYISRGRIGFNILTLLIGLILFALPSHLEISIVGRLLLIALSYFLGSLLTKAVSSGLLKGLTMTQWAVLAAISLYAAFGCVGHKVFMFGNPGIRKIGIYLLSAAWMLVAEICFFYITYRLKRMVMVQRVVAPPARSLARIRSWLLYFIIFAAVGLVYLYAFYPAVMSTDSLHQWRQATGVSKLDDWHPVFHTLFNRFCISIYKSPASIAVVQIVFMAAVCAATLSFLEEQGIPRRWLAGFALLFSLAPQNGINEVTLWKDIPFTISLLWLTLITAKIITYPDFLKRRSGGLQLVLALVGVALFRHNGIVVYMLMALLISWYLIRNRNRFALLYVAASLVLILGFQFFVIDRPDVIQNPAAIKLVAPIHGIAAVMSNEADLPAGVREEMDTILPDSVWLRSFSPYSAEDYQFKTDRVFIDKLSGQSTGHVLGMYFRTLLRHPYVVSRDRLEGLDYLWDLSEPRGGFSTRYNTELEANEIGLAQQGHAGLKKVLKSFLKLSVDWGGIFTWRVGIYNVLLIISMFFVWTWCNEKRGLMIFSPWLFCILSLIPSMILQDFRYVYFVFFLAGFIWLLVLSNVITIKVKSDN